MASRKKAKGKASASLPKSPINDSLVDRLRRSGIDERLAKTLAAAVPLMQQEFPEPSVDSAKETLNLVAATIWADQHWEAIFKAPPKPEIKDKFKLIVEQIFIGLVSSGLWSLLCYVAWALRMSATASGGGGMQAVPRTGNGLDEEYRTYRLELVNEKVFGASNTPPPTHGDLILAKFALDQLFRELDEQALSNPELRRLTQGRAAVSEYQSPSETLFGWIGSHEPKTGLTADDVPKVTERVLAKLDAHKNK